MSAIAEIIATITAGGGMCWGVYVKGIKPTVRKWKAYEKSKMDMIKGIASELSFNGGGSVKDAIFGLTDSVKTINYRLDGIEENQKIAMNLQGIAFWVSDENGECTYASPGLCKVMGRSESEILNSNWMGWLHPEDKQRVVEAWQFSVENKAPFDEIYSYKKSDGYYQKVWGTAFPKAAKSNALGGVLGKLVAIEEPVKI